MKNKGYTVLIIGRENVGKSSIFNKLISSQKSIVDDFPGVTRDKIYGEAEWVGKKFTVIDTGGLLFDGIDRIKNEVLKIVEGVIKEVDLAIFVGDAIAGLLPEDRQIFEFVKRNAKEYIVAVNKVDDKRQQQQAYEFHGLGVDKLFMVSAAHSRGLDDLLDYIVARVPDEEPEEEQTAPVRIAIVGKENVGKSSLFNAIIKEERSIVTEIPGTTRDSIDTLVELNGRKFLIVDTAGIKKRKRIKEKAEEYSIGRAFSNVRRCDIVIHVIDADEGIMEMDKKILGYAGEHYKAVILVINKWDLVKYEFRDSLRTKYTDYMHRMLKFVSYAPLVFTSALNKKGLEKLLEVVFYVENQYNSRVKTSLLNKMFREAVYRKTPVSKKGDVKIYYMTQVSVKPPTFAVFVNRKEKLHFSYMRYLENMLRETFGFEGVPLKLNIRSKNGE
ncbi:MAG: ribosome biogenesis GTPase Der [Spirochaetia bacterium]|nr:ribosome biogenesis GTPase Der [Spirochaetia bacterium]